MASNQLDDLDDYFGDSAFQRGSEGYEARRSVWNATIDRYPAVICACKTTEDLQQAIKRMASTKRAICVRGGGHNIAGTAVFDDAVMLDLFDMRDIHVDVDARTVRVGGGATFSDIDRATQAHGLAVAGGIVSSTGVGGLTLGGGIGWLARRHGLSIDNLVSAEVVLSDGQVLRASATQYADLFWALRGGGGNFGVVTEFEFRAHAVGPDVSFGPTFFDLENAETVLRAYGAGAGSLTRDACVWANLMTAPPAPVLPDYWHGKKVLTLMQFHLGPLDRAKADLEPLYGGVTPLGSALATRPYVEAQSFLDDAYAFGARNYWRSHNHSQLSGGLISDLVELAETLPSPESELLICQLGGAVGDVPADETAFAHRHIPFLSTPGVRWQNPADDDRMIGWLQDTSDRIAAHSVPGAYVNFIAEKDGASAAYQGNLGRLREIKRRYDPDNLFRSNQNFVP